MKRWCFALLILTIPALASAAANAPVSGGPAPAATLVNPAKAPKILFNHTKWDFGKVEEGPEVKHLYRFTNSGKGPLKIERVQPSCGCTGAEAEGRTEIPAGETGAIRVTYNTNGRPGHTIKTVTVITNDPNNQNVVLTFEVDVVRDIDIQPGQVYYYGVKKGESKVQQVKILAKPGALLKVLEAKSVNGSVSITLAPLKEEGREGASLDVTLPADRPIGDIDDEIVCKTDSVKKPEIRIPVKGEVVGRVQVFPKQVYLAGTSGDKTQLNVVADPPDGFAVRRVKMAKGQVKPWLVKKRQPDGKTQFQIEISIARSTVEGPIEDELTVYTNDREQSQIKVPIRGTKMAPPPKQPNP